MMKALKIAGASLLIFVVVAGALLAQAIYRFDLNFNPVVASIRAGVGPWGEMIELTPRPFSVGEAKAEIVAELTSAGFAREPNENVWARYEGEVRDGYELYLREGNDLACNIKYYAFVSFDADNRLASAKGTVHEHGCL